MRRDAKERRPLARGWVIGMAVGVGLGFLIAALVAAWVRSIPVPQSKPVEPSAEMLDFLERQRNKGWNPNLPLQAGAPALPASRALKAGVDAPQASVPHEPVLAVDVEIPADAGEQQGGAARYDYFVQAADFAHSADAEDLRAELAAAGVSAMVSSRTGDGQRRHRVRLGPFSDKEAALEIVDALESKGLDPALVRVAR